MSEPKAEWHLADHLDRHGVDPRYPGMGQVEYKGVRDTVPEEASDTSAPEVEVYDASEQDIIIDTFASMLRSATSDGGRKRAAGLKPPWYVDTAHLPAIFSHLNKYFHGEVRDPDSGAHPLVHAAWRCLAIAYQESKGKHDPRDDR